jgi:hypothetical protein
MRAGVGAVSDAVLVVPTPHPDARFTCHSRSFAAAFLKNGRPQGGPCLPTHSLRSWGSG